MLIKLLIVLFLILLITIGILMLTHLDRPFFMFSQSNLPFVQKTMKITAYLLLLTSLMGIIILIWAPLSWNLLTLVLGSVITGSFALLISRAS